MQSSTFVASIQQLLQIFKNIKEISKRFISINFFFFKFGEIERGKKRFFFCYDILLVWDYLKYRAIIPHILFADKLRD